jgi:LmbE family N-acetylglucosaminyl deacetylase
MAAPGAANVYVDVSETFAFKLAALRAHASQETDRGGQLEARLRGWLTANAAQAGFDDGRLAEAFRRIPTG